MPKITPRSVFVQVVIYGVVIGPLLLWLDLPVVKSIVVCIMLAATIDYVNLVKIHVQDTDTRAELRN